MRPDFPVDKEKKATKVKAETFESFYFYLNLICIPCLNKDGFESLFFSSQIDFYEASRTLVRMILRRLMMRKLCKSF